MGTRSTIALEFADGTVEQVYCHWDGYLSHNGRILAEHYMDPFKLRDLIDQGDLSSLGPNIGSETGVSARKFVDYENYVCCHQYEEFEYILRQVDGRAVWFVDCGATGYVTLETALINCKEAA